MSPSMSGKGTDAEPGGGGRRPGNHSVDGFRDLRFWRQSIDLVTAIYRASEGFPRTEVYGVSSQLRRAVVSIPSNVAERHARESTRECLHHVSVAQASLAEVETQLEIALRLEYLAPPDFDLLLKEVSSVGKQLYALRNALARRT